jgi:hypothetical protein
VRSSQDNVTSEMAGESLKEAVTASGKAVEGQGLMVWSTDVNRCKRRHEEQARSANRPGLKGMWPGAAALKSAAADVVPPAYRRDRTYQVEFVEGGKLSIIAQISLVSPV